MAPTKANKTSTGATTLKPKTSRIKKAQKKTPCQKPTKKGRAKRSIGNACDPKVNRTLRGNGTVQTAPFFKLPAELRNNIYELVLRNRYAIHVEKGLSLPPLLATCSEIRDEASSIWYRDNKFIAGVKNCNATTLNAFSEHACTVGQRDYFEIGIALMGPPNWKNLVQWCQAIWKDGNARRMEWAEDLKEDEDIVCRAHDIAMRYKGKDWEACLGALKRLRSKAVADHRAWGKN
ncbi:hypothetical protein LTR37_015374 [Vermiconidia calcicola]|uniref:Uncharacterized protein n=1 Tax=Vermiconidia calcicola TaxID=1690605 RepID=A0ACC3MQX2_9PEZI|nr:hypothetical protein LTR37_015374 [Vermiconidia calcicola]